MNREPGEPLARHFERIFALLKRLQPIVGEYDVVWRGPYYIPRHREWNPSSFMLYRGQLFASLYIAPHWHGLSWRIGSTTIAAEPFVWRLSSRRR